MRSYLVYNYSGKWVDVLNLENIFFKDLNYFLVFLFMLKSCSFGEVLFGFSFYDMVCFLNFNMKVNVLDFVEKSF